MKNESIILIGVLSLLAGQANAKGGGDRPRPETITCGLTFDGNSQVEAQQSILVQNGQALLRGEAQGVSYVFSVRGKTAVARLTDATQVVNAQGAIEMLRHGGEVRPNLQGATVFKKGDDDANDGTPEREAGFQLSIASPQNPNAPKVSLKCESVNQTQKNVGETI